MRLFRGSASPPRSILPLTILVLGVLAASYPARGQHTAYESPSSGTVTVVDGAGTTVDTGISDAQYLGRLSDLDDDGTLEVPVVDSNGNVELLTKNGMEAMLVSGRAETSKSSLGAGDVNDDGPRKSRERFHHKRHHDADQSRTGAHRGAGVAAGSGARIRGVSAMGVSRSCRGGRSPVLSRPG